jgi:hypothetical protein
VTAVQRYGGAININVHFHSMVLDGVYVADGPRGEFRFVPLDPPSQGDLDRVLERVIKRIGDFLARKGFAGFGAADGDRVEDPDLLAWVQAASIREWTTLSDPPHKVDVIGRRGPGEGPDWVEKPFTAESGSWSLHAGVRIRKGDRKGLEQLARYLLRPPFAEERLERLPDGRALYRFRRPRMDGSTHLLLEPVELLEKLAALVPPPRAHLVHYSGILAPHSRLRSRVIPKPPVGDRQCKQIAHDHPTGDACPPVPRKELPERRSKRRRTDWATLLKRSMGLDPLSCPRCGGRMGMVGLFEEEPEIRRALLAMGLSPEPPHPSPARPPPQAEFGFVQE